MKSNKKRIFVVLAILTMALVLSCALVACDKAGTDKTGTDIVADYKVTIHPNNGQGDIVWDITKEIPTITKDGYHIAGYFLDAQLTISTTLESLKATGITKNIDVYVKWEEDVCEHVAVTDAAVEPTCTEKGLTEGKHCSKCGKILTAQTEIDALGHDLENHAGQPATCTEKGWKAYVTCKREGCDYSTYEEIPALGHTGGTATCTEQATCSVCGEKYGNTLGHNYGTLIPQTNATCSATGIRSHYKCSSCNKLFADDEHKTEITETDLIIPVDENAHDFGKWTRNDGTETHTRVCSFNNEHSETENCHGGTATCTEQAVCEKCNEKYGEFAKHNYKDGVCIVCGIRRPSEGLGYSLNSDGTGYTVTGIGTCTDTELIIPSEYNAKPVTSIGNAAFIGCTGLTSVTIGNSVTSIGGYAFGGCTGLTSVTIGNSVTSISIFAFTYCSGLTSIIVDEGNTKYHSAGNCLIETATKTLILGCKTSVIPTDGSVTSIGNGAFEGCTNLTSITIPDSVTSIGNYAFDGCTGLTSIIVDEGNTKYHSAGNCLIETATKTLILGFKTSVIPTDGSVTSIGEVAFMGCTNLTSITIPDSVTSIGVHAFAGCIGLTNIIVDEGNTKYHSAGNCLIETATKTLILGCKTSVIPTDGSVTSIGNFAFSYYTGLTSITIPDSVTSIGSSAFYGCSGLTSVTIGNSVTSIGNYAFDGCTGLTSVTIPDSVTSIGNYAFDGCTGLTSITIPDSVTSIGSDAFSDCNGLTSISGSATNVSTVAKQAKPTSFIVDITSGTSIDNSAFKGCTGLTSVTIPDSVTSIGNSAFSGCTGLTSITIPNSVTSIGDSAFFGCSGLTSITIPDSVTSIGSQSFSYCTGLTSVTIGNGVKSIGWKVFEGSTGLISINVAKGNTKYHSAGNCVIETESKTLIAGCKNSIIPDDGSVTSIGDSAFQGCSGLTSITIPNSVTSIGRFAFGNCSGLTSITIPNSVTSIDNYAFFECTGLTSVTIPGSVTSIGEDAFYNCTSLTTINFNGTMEQWNAVSKGTNWKTNVPATQVVCTDGEISISEA